jgi:hypothetical protein
MTTSVTVRRTGEQKTGSCPSGGHRLLFSHDEIDVEKRLRVDDFRVLRRHFNRSATNTTGASTKKKGKRSSASTRCCVEFDGDQCDRSRFVEQGRVHRRVRINSRARSVRQSIGETLRQSTTNMIDLVEPHPRFVFPAQCERHGTNQLERLLHVHAAILSRRRLREHVANVAIQQRTENSTRTTQ